MKPFRFSLEAVRIVRQRLEQTTLEQYAQALQSQQRARTQLQMAEQELEAGWSQSRNQLEAGAPAAQLAQTQAYCRFLELRVRECQKVLETAQNSVHLHWQKLIVARQQREVVDRYYQKQRLRYQREFQRQEQKVLDDMANRCGNSATVGKLDLNDFLWN
jgi:flagellar export protein FliJ